MGTQARARIIVAIAGGAMGVVSCLVDIPDVVDGGDAAADGNVGDAPGDAPIVSSCDGGCGAPVGFNPVLFAADQSTACPAGMTTMNGVANPSLGGACACDCNITLQPSCLPQTIVHYTDLAEAGVCSTQSPLVFDADGGCTFVGNGMLARSWRTPPLPPTSSGACASSPANNPSAAVTTPTRLCTDPSCKASCTATAGFKACFVAPGNLACPAPLTAYHVGSKVGVTCGSCTCSVSVDGGCQGSISVYSDNACANLIETAGVDGGCEPNAASGQTFNSVQYNPVAVGLVCTPGTGTGTVTLQQEQTVCCP